MEEHGFRRSNWRVALSAGVAPLLGAAVIFAVAAFLARGKERRASLAEQDSCAGLSASDSDESAHNGSSAAGRTGGCHLAVAQN